MIFDWFKMFRSLLFTTPLAPLSESKIETRSVCHATFTDRRPRKVRRPEQDDYG